MSKYDYIVDAVKSHWITAVILVLIVVVMSVPQLRDGVALIWSWIRRLLRSRAPRADDKPIVLEYSGEQVTFSELLRSVHHDIVKVHAHTETLGVAAEHLWIRTRYPGSEVIKQALTSLDLIARNRKRRKDKVHFDIITIRLKEGRTKEVYFDISSFFNGAPSSDLDPKGFIARRLSDLYKEQEDQV